MKRAISLIVGLVFWTAVLTGTAAAAGPAAFTLHLDCQDGSTFDLDVPVGNSFAALVQGSNSVAVLKGQDLDLDGTPDVLVRGFTVDELVACDTFLDDELIFVAYVLFTPRTG
jgi:hypothetical protein